jgi:D-glycero-D-manno-heptose 1,7-bisphosphate phosphatase
LKRAVFLDRDGVLIKVFAGRPANKVDEVELLPNVVEGLKLLADRGLILVVVTNQGGVGLDYTTIDEVHKMHDKLDELTGGLVARYEVCPHRPDARCECRKPRPGMLLNAAKDLSIDLSLSQIIGDGRSDMEAGVAAGLRAKWLVRTDFSAGGEAFATGVFADFLEAAKAVVDLDKRIYP